MQTGKKFSGKETFDIGDSYILITIYYDSSVLKELNGKHSVGINVGANAGDNHGEISSS